jgi:chromosomal replication initiator protein
VDIEKAVCQTFGLEAGSLQSGRRAKDVSHPRMLAMWLARKYTRSALSEIGHYFGRRSHSTVISAQKRIDDWLSHGQSLALADRDWGVQDAIRQVERRIEAG